MKKKTPKVKMNTMTIDDMIAKLNDLKTKHPKVKYVVCNSMQVDSVDNVYLADNGLYFCISYGHCCEDELLEGKFGKMSDDDKNKICKKYNVRQPVKPAPLRFAYQSVHGPVWLKPGESLCDYV